MGGILAPRLGRCLRGKADPAHKKRAVRSFWLLPRANVYKYGPRNAIPNGPAGDQSAGL